MFQTVQKYDIERDQQDLNEVDFVIYEKDQQVLQVSIIYYNYKIV